MSNSVAEQYYLKAVDSYPFKLENAKENLEYALSYDNEHAGALHMMGCLYMEMLNEYSEAQEYLNAAFASNPKSVKIGVDLALCLINSRCFEGAKKLLTYLHTLQNSNVSRIYSLEGLLYEHLREYPKAIQLYKEAKKESYNWSNQEWLSEEIKRVKDKMKNSKKKPKKKPKGLHTVKYYFSK